MPSVRAGFWSASEISANHRRRLSGQKPVCRRKTVPPAPPPHEHRFRRHAQPAAPAEDRRFRRYVPLTPSSDDRRFRIRAPLAVPPGEKPEPRITLPLPSPRSAAAPSRSQDFERKEPFAPQGSLTYYNMKKKIVRIISLIAAGVLSGNLLSCSVF